MTRFNRPSPCRGCTDRAVGCHANCERYNAWKRELDAYNKRIDDAMRADRIGTVTAATKKQIYLHRKDEGE